MTFLRNIVRDLVEKRLWPVAAVLLLALVATPFALGRTTSEPVGPTPATVTPGGADRPARAVVSLAAVPARRVRDEAVRNPFRAQAVKRRKDADGANAAGAQASTSGSGADSSAGADPSGSGASSGSAAPAGGSDPGAGGGSSPVTVTPKPKPKPKAKALKPVDPEDTHRLTLRFGETSAELKPMGSVARLLPLPSAADPFFVFLGVLQDHKTAVFLISADATVTGDGTCRPSPENCETVELRAGETEFFDLAAGTPEAKQYQLDVVRIVRRDTGAKGRTAGNRTRESKAGRRLLREGKANGQLADALDGYAWSARRGVLVRRPRPVARVALAGSPWGGFRAVPADPKLP